MRILNEEKNIREAQLAFEKSIVSKSEKVDTKIGFPSGQLHASVFWLRRADLWAYFGFPPFEKQSQRRYWNIFGFGKPEAVANIVCEINFPVRGIDRRVGGGFVEAGGLYVLHRGIFNAYRGRIANDFIYKNFRGRWVTVNDGDRNSNLLMIGKLSDQDFIDNLRHFVEETFRVKNAFKG